MKFSIDQTFLQKTYQMRLIQHRNFMLSLAEHEKTFIIMGPGNTCASLIDCMVFNAVFNSISVISLRPVHLSMLSWSSFNQYSAQYSSQATGCFPTKPLSKPWTAVREE